MELWNQANTSTVQFNLASNLWADTGTSIATTTAAATSLVNAGAVAVIGPLRSSYSIAAATGVFGPAQVPQISPASTSAQLSDKPLYPYFFRTLPNDDNQGRALADLARTTLGYKSVLIISTTDAYAGDLATTFKKEFESLGGSTASASFAMAGTAAAAKAALASLKSSGGDSSVIFCSMVTNDAEKVFQAGIELGMVGSGWVWLGTEGSTSSSFLKVPHLENAMQGMLGTWPLTGSGARWTAFLAQWATRDPLTYPGTVHSSGGVAATVFVGQCYDAVAAIGLAAERALAATGSVTKAGVYAQLRTLDGTAGNFAPGVAGDGGKVYFDSVQDAPGSYDVVNLQGDLFRLVGTWAAGTYTKIHDFVFAGGTTVVPSGKRPSTAAPATGIAAAAGMPAWAAALLIVACLALLLLGALFCFVVARERSGKPLFAPMGEEGGSNPGSEL